jgi:hypothetical protein
MILTLTVALVAPIATSWVNGLTMDRAAETATMIVEAEQ